MDVDKDLKKAYEELLKKTEQESDRRLEAESLLTRTIVRLCLACSGLDPNLDPYLKSIRESLRNGVNPDLLKELNELSDTLIRLGSPDEAPPAVVWHKLTSRLRLSEADASEAEKIFGQLQADPQAAGEQELDRLALLLSHAIGGDGKQNSFFDRLIKSKRSSESSPGELPNHLLRELLAAGSWPGHWSTEISRFQARLNDDSAEDEWISVLRELLDLTSTSYSDAQVEIHEAEEFLANLTRRLHDLETHFREAHAIREEVISSGRNLNVEVNAQVSGLQASIAKATDLGYLKRELESHLSGIQQTIDTFLEEEEQRFSSSEERERMLRERMRELEQESEDLHFRMVEAHHLALLDTVTELPNRLAYEERLAQEAARFNRFDAPLALMVWDVDDFKLINDRFGHQAGDKTLHIIAQNLKKRLRETDFIARYGGEEFVSLLCGSDEEQALGVAEEMRLAVEKSGFHSGSRSVTVTISCGISGFIKGDSPEAVFARADKALYEAKRAGKNRCVVADSGFGT
ncbi:GGDEF domain-containing protein [Candidatus Endoriftia persephone]|jgi:diguanylate cyclase|uniref:diguanylate cyclase n=2 Tax=Gammaproteobacteria TaxID=1236 RepID=G2DBK9_9GAMM|nr:GGDEF domain-containing protein [Candidatus Endoriftia persephone]EGV52000.1 diguanylate cyclase [endosymbiont of Riftia pachyptila (vent Ph05)]USF87386.1 GGDEF domain-containing protein [Candidatus Endoriftia persephone]